MVNWIMGSDNSVVALGWMDWVDDVGVVLEEMDRGHDSTLVLDWMIEVIGEFCTLNGGGTPV